MRVEHETVRGITPGMLVWWFRNFPPARLEHQGRLVQMFRIWHPTDHIRFRVLRRPRDRSPGMSRGARVMYSEVIGDAPVRVRARVVQMDEGGVHLKLRRWFVKVGELRHSFSATPDGVTCRSRLVVGSTMPGIGRLVNRFARRRLFPPERGGAWVKHCVEEIGNFEFFLPKLYAERPRDRE